MKKKFFRILPILICVLIISAMIPTNTLFAAEDEVVSISAVAKSKLRLGDHQQWNYDNQKVFDLSYANIEITLNYQSGKIVTGKWISILTEAGMNSGFTTEEINNMRLTAETVDSSWGLGVHKATLSYYPKGYMNRESVLTYDFNIEVIEGEIASITAQANREVTEGLDGWMWQDYQNYFESDYRPSITVNYKDGTSKTFGYDQLSYPTESMKADYIFEGCNIPRFTDEIPQSKENEWHAGNKYKVTATLQGFRCDFYVTVVPHPIKSIAVKRTAPIIENVDGYYTYTDYSDESTKYFRYYAGNTGSWELTLNYTDGKTVNCLVSDTLSMPYQGINYPISIESSQTGPWGLGQHYFTISYMGVECNASVNIVANPVKSISAKATKPIVDGVTINTSREAIAGYSQPELTINYKDGTTKTYSSDELYDKTDHYVEECYLTSDFEDDNRQLVIGKHKATLNYMGFTTEFEVEIVESPIKSISVIPTKKVAQSVVKDSFYFIPHGNGEMYCTGISFEYIAPMITINYKDGSSITCMYYDVEKTVGYSEIGIDSPSFCCDDFEIGKKTVTYSLFGKEYEFEVEVVADGEDLNIDTGDMLATVAKEDGIKVEVKPDTFESGTKCNVEKIVKGSKEYEEIEKILKNKVEKFIAFDITAENDNVLVQPNGKVKVTLDIPDDFDADKTVLLYISEIGEITLLPSVIDKEAKTLTAELTHFSTYVLAQSDEYAEKNSDTTMISDQKSPKTYDGNYDTYFLIMLSVLTVLAASIFTIRKLVKTKR